MSEKSARQTVKLGLVEPIKRLECYHIYQVVQNGPIGPYQYQKSFWRNKKRFIHSQRSTPSRVVIGSLQINVISSVHLLTAFLDEGSSVKSYLIKTSAPLPEVKWFGIIEKTRSDDEIMRHFEGSLIWLPVRQFTPSVEIP